MNSWTVLVLQVPYEETPETPPAGAAGKALVLRPTVGPLPPRGNDNENVKYTE